MQVSLFADGFRNEQFEKNMAFFKDFHPGLYQALDGYVPKQYKICLSPDNTYNIINTENNNLVYPYDENVNTIDLIRNGIDDIRTSATYGGALFDFDIIFDGELNTETINVDPIQKRMRSSLYDIGPFSRDRLIERKGESLPPISSDYIPYLRVYGVGLGYHLQELIRKKNVSFVSIYEPNIDMFYVSLYTISWQLIFQYFSLKQNLFSSQQSHINLYIGESPEAVVSKNKDYLSRVCRYLVLAQTRYSSFSNENKIKKLASLEQKSDQSVLDDMTNGWYEDQRAGFYFAAKNIQKNNKFYTGEKADHFFRVFLVGSGPSLDDSISFIKNNQHDALIVSCGSSYSALLANGIIPDYQVVQERDWHVPDTESNFSNGRLDQVALFKLNVVSTKVDRHYKEVLVFQKYNDPGSSLQDTMKYAVTTHVNPTVTNAGVAIAAELGADEVFLFGVDYGTPRHDKTTHSKSTFYYDIESCDDSFSGDIEVPAVFGGVALTHKVFDWSRRTTEDRIALSPNTRWINVGDGAAIKGTEAVHVEDLHKFSRKFNKKKIMEQIRSCFNADYDGQAIIDELQRNAVQSVADYLDVVLSFSSSDPKTTEELIMVITLMERAMIQHKLAGKDALHYYPAFLVSGGVQEFMIGLFGQAIYLNDDNGIPDLFSKAMEVLRKYRDEIVDDMKVLVDHIVAEGEVEIKRAF